MAGVYTIDCDYIQPRVACAYMIVSNGRAVFVENNTSLAVPILMDALREHSLTPEDVDYVIITHVHLDHAGGTGTLMQLCPHATLLAHPRATKHMIDPGRLISSAKAVYGEEFDRLYGEIIPVSESRVRSMDDGEEIVWMDRSFRFLHTRGHANHHFCIYDTLSNGIFTGDSFGIAYPDLQKDSRFIFPSTTPTEFHPEEAVQSIDKIISTGAEVAYLTHFGVVRNLKELGSYLKKGLEAFRSIGLQAKNIDVEGRQEFCRDAIRKYFAKEVSVLGLDFSTDDWQRLEFDITLNAQGLAFWTSRNLQVK